jgi:protein-L-isoaspartate(D-aspartate) O-methyltransferase
VLAAMHKVDRERFVPEDAKAEAYADHALSIGYGQSISQPYIVALMTELLELRGTEKILEVGTGSGYQAAILGELAKEVYTLEIIPELAQSAAALLKGLGYSNVHARQGDGSQGWREHAPFDDIIVTCAPERTPPALVDQLIEGGRLVIPIGKSRPHQMLYCLRKKAGELTEQVVIPVSFVPMTGTLS